MPPSKKKTSAVIEESIERTLVDNEDVVDDEHQDEVVDVEEQEEQTHNDENEQQSPTIAKPVEKKVDKRTLRKAGNRTEKQQLAFEKLQEGRKRYQEKQKELKMQKIEEKAHSIVRNKSRNNKNKEDKIKQLIKKVMVEEGEKSLCLGESRG